MILRRLSLVNFKNIATETLEFSNGLNCLVGDNGAGKTNILDAVHYLSMCRSSLGGTDRQALRHGGEFFMVEGEYTADAGHTLNVSCGFSPDGGGKKMKCGGKEYERLSDHVGVVPVVIVSPADTFLISDAADERRRWLNTFISQLDRGYLQSLVRYNAVLAERNKLLREISGGRGGGAGEVLDVLDMQLAVHGDVIHEHRARNIAQMHPLVAEYYARLSDDREQVEMNYRSQVSDGGMLAALTASRDKDIANGFSTAGVHRDELVMRIGGDPLRRYGSQGQQKSFLIALKMAQFMVVKQATGETPILLLDDLFDKLDVGRVERLIALASGVTRSAGRNGNQESVSGVAAGQVFISDCNRARLETILKNGGREYTIFEVENGAIV
jgi:DNA replication and repair protein RecF